MRATIARWGNSTAVRLPKAVVDELRLTPGQEVDVTVENGEAKVRPLIAHRRKITIEDMVAEMRRLGPENEPPYEDWSNVEAPWPPYEPDDKV
jgi:antitoxin MazE